MKLKRNLNKWYTRVLLICFLALVWVGVMCVDPYTTNPNLKLLVGDTTTDYDTIHCSNPVVSPDGKTVYYLCAPRDSIDFYVVALGTVYAINVDGTNNKKILDGIFNALAISHDGNKLAIHPYKNYFYLEPESLILVLNSPGSKIDSYPTPKHHVIDAEFSADGQWLYYTVDASSPSHVRTEIYRIKLSDSTNELIQTMDGYHGFDLYIDNRIYFDPVITFPQIEPTKEKYVIGASYYSDFKLMMRNIEEDTLMKLPDSLIPYDHGAVGFPYWFPDGNSIVFAAQPYKEGSGAPAEIWILENIFEQIEE